MEFKTKNSLELAYADFNSGEVAELSHNELVETEGGSLGFILGALLAVVVVLGITYFVYKVIKEGVDAITPNSGGGSGDGVAYIPQNIY